MLDKQKIPLHVAVIMDGNGRWAKRRGLPRAMGHREGLKSVREIVKTCRELGIKFLTLYAFSAENWKRPKAEVDTLMRYLSEYLDKEVPNFIKNGVRLNFIGRIEGLPEDVKPKVKKSVDASKGGKTLSLNVALNYSGRTEIVDAARAFARLVKEGKAEADDLDEKMFSGLLDTAGQPDPDLLIRTSGEMRLSNFLLWQISYSEIYITPKFWPDFRKNDLVEAVREFQKRERRFGA